MRGRASGRGRVTAIAAGLAAALAVASPAIGALGVRTQGTWHAAVELPGTASSSPAANSVVLSVSCALKAWCAAGGSNTTKSNASSPVVSTYSSSSWHHVVGVPGFAKVAPSGVGWVSKLACPSSSNCVALGQYRDAHGYLQVFSARLVAGTWQSAKVLSDFATINAGSSAIDTLSCASTAYCAAGGVAQRTAGPAWFATDTNGAWGKIQFVPTISGVTGHAAQVEVSSCAGSGACTVGGYTTSPNGWTDQRAFVLGQIAGTWRAPLALPSASLAKGTFTPRSITSMSCRALGDCTVVGYGSYGAGSPTAFTEQEVANAWHLPQVVPALAALDANQPSSLEAVACVTPTSCEAGGYYGIAPMEHAFVVNEIAGQWGSAHAVVGFDKLATIIRSISCVRAGSCVAVGSYFPVLMQSEPEQVFVMTSLQGLWGAARTLPGYLALNTGSTSPGTTPQVACSAAGACAVGGGYVDSSGRRHGFVEDGTGVH
jgi:hypothetical protein